MHVALIGARSFGQYHLDGMQSSPRVRTVSIAGRDRAALESVQAFFPKVRRITTDYRELLADPGVDLVDIVLPHDLHLPVALEAFAHGKHVLVEKPPARTPEELDRMRAAAEAAGRRLFVVMNLLFEPLHRTVRRLVDRGAIGRPFRSLETGVATAVKAYTNAGDWRADRERCGGGLLIDGGFHSVYRQLYFLESLGAPRSLVADCAQIGIEEPRKGEDFAALTLAYPGGERIHLMQQWTARAPLGRFPSGILGTEGTLLFTGEPECPLLLRRAGADDEPVAVPAGPRGFQETVAACVEHYLDCLATASPPWVDVDLAALTLEIITSAYSAAGHAGRVELHGSFTTRFPSD